MASLVLCPICSRPAAPRPGNRSFPFCSDRCRLIDLSKWLGGEYRIPGPRLGDEESPRGPAADDADESQIPDLAALSRAWQKPGLWMGFLDLHDHVLWGIDDGCVTPEETLEAARLLASLGWDELAPSPHAVAELPSRDPALCAARRAEAAELFAREGVALKLHANAENKLDEAFLERAEDPATRRGIGPTGRWVLVEAPFQASLPALPDLVFRLRRKGIMPLFAHPERCLEFERPGLVAEVVRLGGAHQLNVGALVGVYGRNARKQAERFLGEGLYSVAATDLHHPGDETRRWLEKALEALEKRAKPEGLRRLCAENPRRILRGEELS